MLRRTLLAGIAGLAVAAASLTAAQARSLDDILADGKIRIGINPNFPNMSVRNAAGEWEGFDIEVGKALAAAIGRRDRVGAHRNPAACAVPCVRPRIDMSLGALTRKRRTRQG